MASAEHRREVATRVVVASGRVAASGRVCIQIGRLVPNRLIGISSGEMEVISAGCRTTHRVENSRTAQVRDNWQIYGHFS